MLFLAYDASVNRLILYVESLFADSYFVGTWEFDIRTGRWEEQQTKTPEDPGLRHFPTGGRFVYDAANQVSALFADFADAYLAMYNASEHRWTVVPHESYAPVGKSGQISGMTYDTVNERIVTIVGDEPRADVIAFDVATGEWITLLEPILE
jgi:hypothetical protein